MANQERIISPEMQALIEQIKESPTSLIPSVVELDQVIRLREEADRRLKESGRVVILGNYE